MKPAGLAAYNSLRIEAGEAMEGYEYGTIDGFDLAPILADQQTRLVGIISTDNSPLTVGSDLTDSNGNFVGVITSATYGTTVGEHIGLGYVSTNIEYKQIIEQKSSDIAAQIVELPLHQP